MRRLIAFALLALSSCASPPPPLPAGPAPLVIAHRGASGELPEHTLEAYRLAIRQGADYIEPDLVMTRDGHLVARHDPFLSASTDIADRPEFSGRQRTLPSPDGGEITDWWVWDFTLEEIRSLRARQPRPGRPKDHDGLYKVPTFDEIIALAAAEGAATGRVIGLYPETKLPVEHAALGLDMAGALEAAIRAAGFDRRDAPVFIQSFEPGILTTLRERIATPLVQLVHPQGWQPGAPPTVALETLAAYADGVGPHKSLLLDPQTGAPTDYAIRARALGLAVHPWTFRDDDRPAWAATPEDEIRAALAAGATGIFTDFPATGRRAVDGLR